MARMTVVYWRDIPAQVIIKQGRQSAKVKLSERFEHGIDRAAMRAGRGGSDAYLEDWRRENEAFEGSDMQAVAEARAAELESEYDEKRLEALIKAGGHTPTS
ncbi:MAG: virulence factor [Pseudomonadota bacterium]